MKLLKTLLILSLLFSGCMKNDMDDCPYNAMLTFRYYGDETSDQFAKMIDVVTLYVFSDDGRLVTVKNLSRQELRAYQGTNLKLNPGRYHFVCWGNTFDDTKISGEDNLSNALLQHPNLLNSQPIPTNDHLYFGTYDLDLPKHDILAGEVVFSSAHINLEIYTKGAGTTSQLPAIEVQNLIPRYDFSMATTGLPVTYYPAVVYDPEKEASVSKLQVLRFSNDNPIQIDIKDPLDNGNTITSVNLSEFMAANQIQVDNVHEATIQILVEFGDIGVNVTIPDWKKEDIDPSGPEYNGKNSSLKSGK